MHLDTRIRVSQKPHIGGLTKISAQLTIAAPRKRRRMRRKIASVTTGRVKCIVFGNAIGNSIVGAMQRRENNAQLRNAYKGQLGQLRDQGVFTQEQYDTIVGSEQFRNTDFVALRQGQVNALIENPGQLPMNLTDSFAQDGSDTIITRARPDEDPPIVRPGYRNGGVSVDPVTGEYLWVDIRDTGASVEAPRASTNASFFGIDDASLEAQFAAPGETTAGDAAWYAFKYTGYQVWNFATAGFVTRHDERLSNPQLQGADFARATALDAAGSVGSLLLAGRVGGYAAGRLGSSIMGYAGAGAAGGAAFDLTQQATGLGINAMTGGQAGQDAFSWQQLTASTAGGAALGGAFGLAGRSPMMTADYRLQFPVRMEGGTVFSANGFGGIQGFQSPIVRTGGSPQLYDIVPYSTKAPGFEKHHGVLDAWARANVSGYSGGTAPTVVLTPAQHNATRAVFNTWRAEQGLSRTKIDWARVSPVETQALTYRMFGAAGVPDGVTSNYIRAFNQHIYAP